MSTRVIVAVLAAQAVFGAGFWLGHSKAASDARAAMAEEQQKQASAIAEDLRLAQAALREEARKVFLIDFALQKERNTHAQEKTALLARVQEVTRGSTHTFGPGFVGLWNEAIGVPAGARLPAAPDNPGADAAPGTAQGSVCGFHDSGRAGCD